MNRCGVCGRRLRIAVSGASWRPYCPGCGAEWPAEIAGYNPQADYTTPDGRFQFAHRAGQRWERRDTWDGDREVVLEEDLPGDLILLSEWQAAQCAEHAIAQIYGSATQLSLLEVAA